MPDTLPLLNTSSNVDDPDSAVLAIPTHLEVDAL